jgi:hypothetical protein
MEQIGKPIKTVALDSMIQCCFQTNKNSFEPTPCPKLCCDGANFALLRANSCARQAALNPVCGELDFKR